MIHANDHYLKKGESMSKSTRLIELLLYINKRHKFTARELAQEFNVSYRTILRDLDELSGLGLPFYSEVGHGGGYYVIAEKMLPPLFLKETEAMALYFSFQSLEFVPTLPFKTETDYALEKLYQHFSQEARKRIKKMNGRIAFWNPPRQKQALHLDELLEAAVEHTPITIVYEKEDELMERIIQPIGIYSSHGFWYCPSYCFTRNAIRLFRADRIKQVEKTRKEAVDLPFQSVQEWLSEAEETGEKSVNFLVELSRTGIRKAQSIVDVERFIKVEEDGSGWIEAVVPEQELPYFVQVIWTLGPEAVIKEPQVAIDLIKEKVQAMWTNYV
ncbi:helix-turn-helix transcriptional regulator [Shouchella hunanensis]|uniref:YafY family protein n=1 Tax=Shouchella hunanensis TaxID=766894 RepID=A0ABY7W693_9BACI|nr:YafY family protein [Shouchella hunanensis]WDF02250.1 YafY family protein [Shouchella hunanensis]